MNVPRITSRQNGRVKHALQLRERKWRNQRGQFLIDGAREIGRAIDAGVVCREAFVCDELLESDESRTAALRIAATSAELLPVTPEVFAKLAFGDRDDGLVVVADSTNCRLAEIRLPANPLIVVVEGIEKPGNLGAILRSADATGADAVIVTEGGTDIFNPNTIRASLGTVFREHLCTATAGETVQWLETQGVQIVAAQPDAAPSAFETDLRGPTALVLGSEAGGLSDTWRTDRVAAVRLPMLGVADSLNVSATAAVMLYEALRQRTAK